MGQVPQIQQLEGSTEKDAEEEMDLNELLPPITKWEIKARIKRTKRNTAAGPDGILRKHITDPGTQEVLRLFYNFITACGRQPTRWKSHKTILLPKRGKDPARVENYRPITIGSLLSRVYWGILDQKLRAAISFTPRQKGFVNEAGCFNDVHILNETLKLAKQRARLVVVQLDISKAFDTVPHEAIEEALRKKRIPSYVTKFIRDAYEGATTIIKYGKYGIEVPINRGVKQGDPLSPLIFNAVIEPLILELESQQGFKINDECQVSSLAFADDIILLAPGIVEAKILLETTEKYLQGLGMGISAPKCAAFQVCTTRDTWYLTDPVLTTANGDRMPNAEANTQMTACRIHTSVVQGITASRTHRSPAIPLARSSRR
jgi:hypothetical protein